MADLLIRAAEQAHAGNLEKRLRSRRYIHADAVAAFEGKRLPHDLGRDLTRLCVVRGNRFHADFCFGPAAVSADRCRFLLVPFQAQFGELSCVL